MARGRRVDLVNPLFALDFRFECGNKCTLCPQKANLYLNKYSPVPYHSVASCCV